MRKLLTYVAFAGFTAGNLACEGRSARPVDVQPPKCAVGKKLGSDGKSCVDAPPADRTSAGSLSSGASADPGYTPEAGPPPDPSATGDDSVPSGSSSPDSPDLDALSTPTPAGGADDDDETNAGGLISGSPSSGSLSSGSQSSGSLSSGSLSSGSLSSGSSMTSTFNTKPPIKPNTGTSSSVEPNTGVSDGTIPRVRITLGTSDVTYQLRFSSTAGITNVSYETKADFRTPTAAEMRDPKLTEVPITSGPPTVLVKFSFATSTKKRKCTVEFTGLVPGRDSEQTPTCVD